MAFSGFTTLFDVLDSFQPDAPLIGYRVPPRPEGLLGADRFDTYWGSITRPLDFALAHPLRCAYPNHQPQV